MCVRTSPTSFKLRCRPSPPRSTQDASPIRGGRPSRMSALSGPAPRNEGGANALVLLTSYACKSVGWTLRPRRRGAVMSFETFLSRASVNYDRKVREPDERLPGTQHVVGFLQGSSVFVALIVIWQIAVS